MIHFVRFFHFLLDKFSALQADNSEEGKPYVELLRIFAYGSFRNYKGNNRVSNAFLKRLSQGSSRASGASVVECFTNHEIEAAYTFGSGG